MNNVPAGKTSLAEFQEYPGILQCWPRTMDQYLDKHIEEIGNDDGECKVRFPPSLGQEEER